MLATRLLALLSDVSELALASVPSDVGDPALGSAVILGTRLLALPNDFDDPALGAAESC